MSGVRAIHQLTLSTSPTLCSHPGPGYWPVIFIITTYYLEQEKSRYITSIPSVLTHSGVRVENREKRSYVLNNNVPDFEVWVVNSGLEGERIVHLSPLFSSHPVHISNTKQRPSVLLLLDYWLYMPLWHLTWDNWKVTDRGGFLFISLRSPVLKYDDLMGNIFRRVNW